MENAKSHPLSAAKSLTLCNTGYFLTLKAVPIQVVSLHRSRLITCALELL